MVSVYCPPDFDYLDRVRRCYRVVRESDDWNSAAKRCRALSPGSHLVAIETRAENVALKAFLASKISSMYNSINVIMAAEYALF